MSVVVMSQVWAAPPVGGSQLLVLLALADNADEDRRYAWPSVATLSRKTLLSGRSVQRALRDLENDGIIRTVRPGGRVAGGEKRATVYEVLPDPKGDNLTPTERGMGDTGGSARVTPVSPQPSTEPSVPPGVSPRTRDVEILRRWKIASQSVDSSLWATTLDILDVWCESTEQNIPALDGAGNPSALAKRVYLRCRAWPDLTLDQHKLIIANTLASKWWGSGEPTVGVVYGPNVFEDNMRRKPVAEGKGAKDAALAERRRRGMAALAALAKGEE